MRLDALADAAAGEILDEATLSKLRGAADDAARLALRSRAEPVALEVTEQPPALYYPDLVTFVITYRGLLFATPRRPRR